MSLPLAAAYLLTSTTPGAAVEAPETVVSQPAPETMQAETERPDAASQDGLAPQNSIIVTGELEAPPGDPLEKLNLQTFELTQSVDRALVAPVAEVYEENLPKPARRALRNFFRNLLEPVNFLNYLLQFKPGKAFETLGRFTLNSTVGLAGIFDVAKKEPFKLPYRRNGFANTLGYYGVGPGPFLVVPLVGATTLRDLLGGLVDQSVVPLAVGSPFNTPYYAIPAYTVNSLEFRINFDSKLKEINDSVDPYSAMRETYLCQREADIAALKNRPPPRDCRLDALFAELDAKDAAMAPASAPAMVPAASGTATDAAQPVNAPESDPAITVVEEAGSEPAPQMDTPALHQPSLSLEDGCAFLEQGVDSLHVVPC
jgi:phospholipid-binding lipoprotein MlaA